MIKHKNIRAQRVVVVMAKRGTIKHKPIVDTNLDPSDSEFDELLSVIHNYMAESKHIDEAEINSIGTIS